MSSRLQVMVGDVPVGGGAPVVVQSMTNTRTDDVEATLGQIRALATAGAGLVRVAVPDPAAARAVPALVAESPVPLIADVHFDHELAVAAVAGGAAGVRINPGNIGGREEVRAVVEAAREHGAVIRIGVNSGSLQRDLRELEERDPAGALVESAVRYCALLEELDFHEIKVSAKSSSPLVTIAANRLLAERIPYPLHLGVTEAGTRWAGSIRSAVALGVLLAEGIGDTIRVSLTGDPVEEVRVALEILRTLELAPRGPRVISCPTCGRTRIDLEPLALEVERRLEQSGPGPGGGGHGLRRQRSGRGAQGRLRHRRGRGRRSGVRPGQAGEEGGSGRAGGRAVRRDRRAAAGCGRTAEERRHSAAC